MNLPGTLQDAEAVQAGGEFPRLLEGFRGWFDAELEEFLRARCRAARERGDPELAEAVTRLVEAGGKRLRPALVYFSYRACRGDAGPGDAAAGPRDGAAEGGVEEGGQTAVLLLAMAVELLHTYLLVHDDIMDRAETRRGVPAAHRHFRDLHVRREDDAGVRAGPEGADGRESAHFGRSAAILVGDLAYTWASDLFHRAAAAAAGEVGEAGRRGAGEHDDALRRRATLMCEEVIQGQYLELRFPHQEPPSEEELLRVLRLKSGRYTVEHPVLLGATLAGASEETMEALGRYGQAVGEAFQLQDDVLGTFGDPDTVGKPTAGDLSEGKRTFLVHHTLERARPADARRLRGLLGRDGSGVEEIEEARAIMRRAGGLAAVTEMVERRLDDARTTLKSLILAPEGREFLSGLIDYLRDRRR